MLTQQLNRQNRPQTLGNASTRPRWDSERRELWFGEILIKRFHTPAPCQEAILEAFEQEGWPPRIDDPLPFLPAKKAKSRMYNAMNCLNRSHRVRVICFGGDGTGEGNLWARL